jgi:hypothetical protein
MDTILEFKGKRAVDVGHMIYDLANKNDPEALDLLENLTVTITVPITLLGIADSHFNLTCSLPGKEYMEWVDGSLDKDYVRNVVLANIYNVISMDFDSAVAVIGK